RAFAWIGAPPKLIEFYKQRGLFEPPAGTPLDRLLLTKKTNYTADDSAEPNPGARQAWRRTISDRGPNAQGRRLGWRNCYLSPRAPPLHRQTDRAPHKFRPPGGHPHRKPAAPQRAARVPTAAARDRRCAQGHQPLDLRSAGRAPHP